MLASAVGVDPMIAVEPLRRFTVERAELDQVERWPDDVRGFEDLAFLFTSSELNFGIALLGFDEAAFLYSLARDLRPGSTLVEIGRLRGGSTLIFAAATRGETDIWSIDLHHGAFYGEAGREVDARLRAALDRFGIGSRVSLIVGDSRTAAHPERPCDLVLIDGDHEYDGVRADYLHWRSAVRPGGHLLFHDAAEQRRFSTPFPGVQRLVAEIERDDARWLERRGGAGSIVHFVRTDVPWPNA